MAEVEVKAKLNSRETVFENLKNLGCVFSEPVTQKDLIYIRKDSVGKFDPSQGVLRIRTQDTKTIFTLKKDRKNELDCIEHETLVEDAAELEQIILQLNFKPYVKVEKTRQKTKFKEYEICIDEVTGLGPFIEVEKISDEDGEKIQQELFDFLKTLGISDADRVMRGYDSLLYEKNNSKR